MQSRPTHDPCERRTALAFWAWWRPGRPGCGGKASTTRSKTTNEWYRESHRQVATLDPAAFGKMNQQRRIRRIGSADIVQEAQPRDPRRLCQQG